MNEAAPLLACAAAVEAAGLEDLGVTVLGVGKVAAAVAMTARLAQRRPAAVLLFGVAGAYPERHRAGARLRVGDLCVVGDDGLADEGVATPAGFSGLAQLGLGETGPFRMDPSRTATLASQLGVPIVRGATVSTCSGNDALSALLAARSGAEVESMEGAAVAFACASARVPLVQLRAVSNLTGDRDRGGWDLRSAIARVQAAVRGLRW